MKVTEAFLGEHGVFYAQFDYLESDLPKATLLDWVKVQAQLVGAALKTHAQLEEELLFIPLDPHLGQMGPLNVMRMEHNEIEGTLEILPHASDLETARGQLLNMMQVARQHFAKEEQVLYPMAEKALSYQELSELGQMWAERRSVAINI